MPNARKRHTHTHRESLKLSKLASLEVPDW